MAKIGFEYIVAAELDAEKAVSEDTASYTNGKEIGPGANFSVTVSANDAKDYGDDRLLVTDVSVTGGTISAELNEPTLEIEAWLLGHKYNETSGVVRNAEDTPPYLGVGIVGKSRSSTKKGIIYRAKVYLKNQFKEPNDEHTSKQDSTTFNHTTLDGNLFVLKNGDWKIEKEFDSLDEAKTFVDTKLGITAAAAG